MRPLVLTAIVLVSCACQSDQIDPQTVVEPHVDLRAQTSTPLPTGPTAQPTNIARSYEDAGSAEGPGLNGQRIGVTEEITITITDPESE